MANKQNRVPTTQQPKVVTVSSAYIGPIPKADELKKYEDIQSGFADRILAMAEKQALHRQALEFAVIQSNISNAKLGIMFAFILSIIIIFIGGGLLYFDKLAIGIGLISFMMVSLISIFIYGKKSQANERKEKIQMSVQPENFQK